MRIDVHAEILSHPNGPPPCVMATYSYGGYADALYCAIDLNKQIRGIKNMKIWMEFS